MSAPPTNHIVDLSWAWRSTAAYEAELRLAVTPQWRTPTTEVRGRLTGPRCRYASTIEIAHPLQTVPGPSQPDGPLIRRVVVPEASLWEPESPFLYDGVIELVQDGHLADRRVIRTGLRSLSLGPAGLRVNGRPLSLHGTTLKEPSTPTVLLERRHAGINLLLAPVTPQTAELWSLAEAFGFFLIGLLAEADPSSLELARRLSHHVTCFGWLAAQPPNDPPAGRLGLLADVPPAVVPPSVSFLCLPAHQAALGAAMGLPMLVRGATEQVPLVFGTVEAF